MKFINDDWLARRAERSSKRDNQGSPTLIGLLKNEIETLNNRVLNLNTFKNLFFSVQEQLISEKEKNTTLRKIVNQQRIGEPVAESVFKKLDEEYFDDGASNEYTDVNPHQAIVCIPSDDDELALSNEDLEEAKDLILLSLSITNEYNLLIDNLLATSEASSFDELTQHIISTLKEYDLVGAVQIRSKFGQTNKCSDNDKKEEYQSLIDQLTSSEPVYQFDEFYIFNDQHISLIISGLPAEAGMYERYIDYVKRIVSASEHKIVALDNKRHLNNQHKNLKSLVDGTHTSITQIQKASKEQSDSIQSLFTTMGKELGSYLNTIELSPQDKKNVLKFVASKRENLTETLSNSISLDDKFVGVIKQLKQSFTKPKEES